MSTLTDASASGPAGDRDGRAGVQVAAGDAGDDARDAIGDATGDATGDAEERGLRARPDAGATFLGRDPATVATGALAPAVPGRCRARTRRWRDGVLEAEGFAVAEITDHLGEDGVVVWLDLDDPETEDLGVLVEQFGLHPLAVEDAVHEHQRPKLDRYPDHLFLSTYAVALDPATGEVSTSELAAFLTPQALITVRKDDGFDVGGLVQRWDDGPGLAVHGVGGLLYGLLDDVVDGHFATVRALDDEVEGLEELLFAEGGPDRSVQQRSFALRKSLVLTRRVVLPMREVVNALMRRDLGVVDAELTPYYQDVYDHVLRATEWTESLRDLVSTVMETRLTLQGNRLNEIMKKLTAWASIIAVPTAVTGFYGQNVPYPGFDQAWGAWTSVIAVIVIGLVLYTVFKRKDWL